MHLSVEPSESTGRRASTKASVHAPRRPRVLVAEDEWTFRAMLLWAFEVEGYRVLGVADGRKLLEVLASSMLTTTGLDPFDMVVSDIRMPGWSGLPALEELCRSPLVPPVVVITAFGSDDLHHRVQEAGAAAVLDKPFDLADLTALVRRLMAVRSA